MRACVDTSLRCSSSWRSVPAMFVHVCRRTLTRDKYWIPASLPCVAASLQEREGRACRCEHGFRVCWAQETLLLCEAQRLHVVCTIIAHRLTRRLYRDNGFRRGVRHGPPLLSSREVLFFPPSYHTGELERPAFRNGPSTTSYYMVPACIASTSAGYSHFYVVSSGTHRIMW